MANTQEQGNPVMVITKWRGIFFGYTDHVDGDTIILKQCRNIIYWDSSVHGFLGLAVTGPSQRCRVGPAAPEFTVYGVTGWARPTEKAIAAWEAEPWG